MTTGVIIFICFALSLGTFVYCRLRVQELINHSVNKNLNFLCYFFTVTYAAVFIISLIGLTKSMFLFYFFIVLSGLVSIGMLGLVTIFVNNKSSDEF